LLLKLLPYNRSINANEDIVIKVDINKHSVVIMDVRKRKSYCLNDFDLSGNDDFLDIITSIIDWNKIIKNINSILDEELAFKHDNYNFICDLIDSLRKQEISNEEDGKDYADDRCEIKII